MKREALAFIFLFTICQLAVAGNDIKWYSGSIVLQDNTVLVGELSVEANHELVLLRHEGKVDVYPAHKLASLYFYDNEANVNRRFISVKEDNLTWRAFHLYEIVLRGDVCVFRKMKAGLHTASSEATDFDYFVRLDKQFLKLDKFRHKVYPTLLKNAGLPLSVYISENKLNPNEPANAIKIVQYYNQLQNSDVIMARY